MKVADLFAELDIRPDKRSVKAADKVLGGIKSQLLGIASAAAVAFGVRDALNFSRSMRRLETAAGGAMGTTKQLEDRILAVSDATGVAKEEVAAGAAAFVSLTGDADAAKSSMELFAKVQVATGGSMEDISKTAAALQQNLKIKPENFEKAFSILIAGGKAGAIELKDAAGVLSSLTPLMEQFEGGAGIEGLAELGASLQLSRQGFGSAKETATGLKALFGSFKQNAKKFEAVGIKIFDKDPKTGQKTLRNFSDIISEIGESKLALDPTLLTRAFGSKEAEAAFTQLTKNKGALEDLTQATLEANDVNEDYIETQANGAFKVAKAWNKLKNILARAFLIIARGLELILDHATETLIVIGALAAAFVILEFAAVKAMLATAASAIIAVLPFVLLAALIAAVIFVVQDLWSLFTGGPSVLADLHTAAVDAFVGIIEWVDRLIDKAGGAKKAIASIIPSIPGISNLLGPLGRLGLETATGGGLAGAFEKAKAGETAFRENFQGSISQAFSPIFNINVPEGTDAAGVARAGRVEMENWWDEKVRETAAATEN